MVQDGSRLSEFYSRQTALAELGEEGQRKLERSKVAVVGVGGVGSAAACFLALAGVGRLTLIDQDVVEPSNLHRQVLFDISDVRLPKVEAAERRISRMNPNVRVEVIADNVNEKNVGELLTGCNVVVDGLDNMWTRYVINRVCVTNRLPLVFGGALGFEGNVSVFDPPDTPCLECAFPALDDSELPTCETRGILGATTSAVGSIQALETIKLIGSIPGSLRGKLLVCDFSKARFYTVPIYQRDDCPICGSGPALIPRHRTKLTWLCGSSTVNINPGKEFELDFSRVADKASKKFTVLLTSLLAVVLAYDEKIEVTIFSNGRAIVRNVPDERTALKVYEELFDYF